MEQLGFMVQDLSVDIARQFGYQKSDGIVISQVRPGTPAHQVGLRPGMLITEVNKQSVRTTQGFLAALESSLKSKKVLLLVQTRQVSRYIVLEIP
jgi:S1-C subfamily serine protease